jgi:hypothetical protein
VNGFSPRQGWVRIERRRVLVRPDTIGRPFDNGCILKPPQAKPCTSTLNVKSGHSQLVRIDDRPVCLSNLTGLTDGLPQTTYRVHRPGQRLVGADT